MIEHDAELDRRLRRGLEDVPIRPLSDGFDDRVIAASRQALPWHFRLQRMFPQATLSVALAVVSAILVLVVIIHLRHVATIAYQFHNGPVVPAGPGTDEAGATKGSSPHYGNVLGTP